MIRPLTRHLVTIALLACSVARLSAQSTAPVWEVYAVSYGTLLAYPTAELIAGADSARRTDAAFMVWAMKGAGNRVVLVDAGFYRDEFMQEYHPGNYLRPSDAVAGLGIKPATVTDVIISHVHWDHMDGVDLFPNATIWIQRAEYEYYIGPKGEKLHSGVNQVDATMMDSLRKAGRVQLVDGDNQEIIPGIRVYTGGRHTWASQYAGVQTRSGTVVIASDNMYLYENLDRHLAIGTTFDAAANLAAQDRMVRLAAERRLVIPGHDAALFDRFPHITPRIVRID